MLRITLRSLLERKVRLVLSALAIVVGVMAVSGSLVLTDTLRSAFLDLFSSTAEGVAVTVRGESALDGFEAEHAPVPESVLADVVAVGEVSEAYGTTSGYAAVVGTDGSVVGGGGPPTLGVTWVPSEAMNPLRIAEGRPPAGPGEVVVDEATAAEGRLAVGDRVRIVLRSGLSELTLVGTARFGASGNLVGATLAAFDGPTAQTVLGSPGFWSDIAVAARPGVSEDALAAAVSAVLPEGYEAVTRTELADEGAEQISEGLGFFQTALLAFAGIALFVGAFLIHNTFAILVGQRTRELALMRAIGASRAQTLRTVLVEAAAVGLVASVVGFGLGILVAAGLRQLLGSIGLELTGVALQIRPATLVWSVLVGVGVSLVAALGPARRAARTSPMEALRLAQTPPATARGRRTVVGLVLAVLGVALVAYGLGGGPFALTGVGAVVGFIGLAALSPLLVRPVAHVLVAPVARWVPARLGRDNTTRNPGRTATTAAALMVGMAFVAAAGIFGASVKASVATSLEESLGAELVISGTSPQGFSPAIGATVADEPGVAYASAVRSTSVELRFADGPRGAFLSGVDPATVGAALRLEASAGDVADLAGGGVALAAPLATDRGVTVGDTVAVIFPATGEQRLAVTALYATNQVLGDAIVSLATFDANAPGSLDQAVFVGVAPGADPETVRAEVAGVVAPFPDVELQDRTELIESQQSQIDQLINVVYVLLALAVVIALLGIVNTLALSTLERTSEIGMLRAVGMSRPQVRAMIRVESVIIAVLGALLGLASGAAIGWALVRALEGVGLGTYAVPWSTLLLFLAIAVVAGIAAAALPARRAARIRIVEAVASE